MFAINVTRCLDDNSNTSENRKQFRARLVAWLEEHVGKATTYFADGTATAGDGWKFVTKDKVTDSEPVDLGMGKISWKHTYRSETHLVFRDEADAMYFKLTWSDSL